MRSLELRLNKPPSCGAPEILRQLWRGTLLVGLGISVITLLGTLTDSIHAEVPVSNFVQLFNGRDLSGWKGLVADPKKRAEMSAEELAEAQKTADEQMRSHWKVVDGVLEFDGEGDSICTEKNYADFELYVDWKIMPGGDSGIYLRGIPQVQIWDPEHQSLRKHGADKGSGGLWNNQRNSRFPLVKADKPTGEWNTFYVKMVGDRVTVKLNGKLVVDNVVLENYWERDVPIPTEGPIELQNHGSKLSFRNLVIREITNSNDKKTSTVSTAISPSEGAIQLFDGQTLNGFYTWLQDTKYKDPREVFRVTDGMLHVTGDGYGGIITKKKYRHYHMIFEYRWGEQTWRERKDKARDSGVLIHSTGADGGYNGMWMPSIEVQVIEGGVGDFILVHGADQYGKPVPLSLTSNVSLDRDGEIVWNMCSPPETFNLEKSRRINWYGRDPDWKDALGFRGPSDPDSLVGKWTRLDVRCEDESIKVFVNGIKVNEAFEVYPSEGRLQLQTELAELYVRRWELWPLMQSPIPDSAQ
jgi:hypothetical protein